jgi:hypothetical protein
MPAGCDPPRAARAELSRVGARSGHPRRSRFSIEGHRQGVHPQRTSNSELRVDPTATLPEHDVHARQLLVALLIELTENLDRFLDRARAAPDQQSVCSASGSGPPQAEILLPSKCFPTPMSLLRRRTRRAGIEALMKAPRA